MARTQSSLDTILHPRAGSGELGSKHGQEWQPRDWITNTLSTGNHPSKWLVYVQIGQVVGLWTGGGSSTSTTSVAARQVQVLTTIGTTILVE